MNIRIITWIQYLGFITIGLISGITGPMIPAIRYDIPMSYTQSGIIISGQFIGMFFIVIVGGYIADRFGKKLFLIMGSILLIIGLIGCMFSFNYIELLVFIVILGIGFGIYEIGINALCADLSYSKKGKAMNYLHFFFGLGAIISPLLATFCINIIKNWRFAFGIITILPALVGILFLNQKLIHKVSSTKFIKEEIPFKNSFIWFAGISIFIYVGIEVSIYGWLPSFWAKLFPENFIPASLTAIVFWICLTFGRLLTGKFVDKIGFSKYLIITACLTFIMTFIWFVFPYKYITLVSISLIGFFLSGIFPTIIASTTSFFSKITGIITGFITVFASLGGLFIPISVGYFSDYKGIKILPFIILLMGILLASTIFITWKILIKYNND